MRAFLVLCLGCTTSMILPRGIEAQYPNPIADASAARHEATVPAITPTDTASACASVVAGSGLRVLRFHHRSIINKPNCTIRLPRSEQLLVEVLDAHPLLYDYSLQTQALTSERAPDAIARYLGAIRRLPGAAGVASTLEAGDPTPRQLFDSLANRLLNAGAGIRTILLYSDDTDTTLTPADLTNKIRDLADTLFEKTRRTDDGDTFADLWRQLARLRDAALTTQPQPGADQIATIHRLYDDVAILFPGAAIVGDQLRTITIGPRQLLWTATGEGDIILRLVVTHRIPLASYQPRRLITTADAGLNIAEIRTPAPWFQTSVGLAFSPGRNQTYSTRYDTDTTFVELTARDPFTPVPSTFFTLRVPWLPPHWLVGVTGGIGLRVTESDVTLGEAIDYSAMATVGYRWIRVNFGVTWALETDASLLPSADSAGRRFIAGQHELDSFERARTPYFGLGLSFTP